VIDLTLPTPVERAAAASRAAGVDLWIKRDDLTSPIYGGNKARKLAPLLARAVAAGATDLVTVGPLGSHHVLSTARFGRALGLAVHAVVAPHPATAGSTAAVAAALAAGATLHPAGGDLGLAVRAVAIVTGLRLAGRRPYLVPPGASSGLGALGYLDAMLELREQILAGALPWPAVIACPVGSGGTLAGLCAGAALCGAPSRIVGFRVRDGWSVEPRYVALMARRALALRGVRLAVPPPLVLDGRFGAPYGAPTEEGRAATALLAADGVALDPAYTARAAAGLLALCRRARPAAALLVLTYAAP
jgi:D-cysteine desulfhydrase